MSLTTRINSPNSLTLSFVHLNVCGIMSKIDTQDFKNLIKSHDFVCLNETKLDDVDASLVADVVDDSEFFYCNRTNCKRRSGGVGVFYKSFLKNYVQRINVGGRLAQSCIMFMIKQDLIGCNLLCISLYIPPEGSKFSTVDLFDDVVDLLINTKGKYNIDRIVLLGDLNARVGPLQEVVEMDAFNAALDGIRDEIELKIEPRTNRDKTVNLYGRTLINACKTTDLVILNGRTKGDLQGNLTTNGTSAIDLVLCDRNTFHNVVQLNVEEFDPLYSDHHCIVSMELQLPIVTNLTRQHSAAQPNDCNQGTLKWRNECKTDYVIALLENPKLPMLFAILSTVKDLDNEAVSQSDIDDMCALFKELLETSALSAGLSKVTITPTKIVKQGSPWYDKQCVCARKEYHKSKALYRKFKSDYYLTELKKASKQYKNTIKKAKELHQNTVLQKLISSKTTDTSEYWKILNNSTKKKKVTTVPSVESLNHHFSQLFTTENDSKYPAILDSDISNDNDYLNAPFTTMELEVAIKKLKTKKAAGPDNLLNEFFINAPRIIWIAILDFFNVILSTAHTPTSWELAYIHPIFKNKGDPSSAENYRGISLLSTFAKLFTSMLSSRIHTYMESSNLLRKEQAGFRSQHSTLDHIFNLKTIIDIYYKNKKKKLYCAFIDFKKAFDSIDHKALWIKLLQHNIDGNVLKVVRDVYSKAKASVRSGTVLSNAFPCEIGVRQGDNLSPILFAIFLNDLSRHLSRDYDGLKHIGHLSEDTFSDEELETLLNLSILLYADDTTILAESAEELQKGLDSMKMYCEYWSLTINADKTKICVFSSRNCEVVFNLDGHPLETVKHFSFLGVTFSSSGRFKQNEEDTISKASSALFALYQKIRVLNLPPCHSLELFDKLISPIVLYGCEIWGMYNFDKIEQVHTKFCKRVLKLRVSTCNAMIYGETGRFPLAITVKERIVTFWHKLTQQESKLSGLLLKLVTDQHNNHNKEFKWLSAVKTILDSCGISYIFTSPHLVQTKYLQHVVRQILKDQFLQEWVANTTIKSSCTNYRIFKTGIAFECYLDYLPTRLAIAYCKFRCRNTNFPIVKKQLGLSDRAICTLCDGGIGDEFHYLFECQHFVTLRSKYVPLYFRLRPNTYKFAQLFNHKDFSVILNLAKFISVVMKSF